MLRWQDSVLPVWLVSGELTVLCVLALAAAAVLAARGESEPGGLVAPAVGLLGIGALIADLLVETAIFMPWDGSGGGGVRPAWASLGGLAVFVFAVASRDPRDPARSDWQWRAGASTDSRPASGNFLGPSATAQPLVAQASGNPIASPASNHA